MIKIFALLLFLIGIHESTCSKTPASSPKSKCKIDCLASAQNWFRQESISLTNPTCHFNATMPVKFGVVAYIKPRKNYKKSGWCDRKLVITEGFSFGSGVEIRLQNLTPGCTTFEVELKKVGERFQWAVSYDREKVFSKLINLTQTRSRAENYHIFFRAPNSDCSDEEIRYCCVNDVSVTRASVSHYNESVHGEVSKIVGYSC